MPNANSKPEDDQTLAAALRAWCQLDSSLKGSAGESWAAAWLAAHGLDVWKPVAQHHRADLGVFGRRGLIRLQVRTAGYSESRRVFRASFMRRASGRTVRYRRSEIDFWVVVCPLPQPALYILPASAVTTRASGTFAPHRRRRRRRRGIDFEQYRDAVDLLRRRAA
jgi:PD-(D/E)XK endonuclease